MAVSIRVPAETHTTPPNFSYRHRPSSRLSPRLLRRIVPVIVLIILTFEGYRLLTATPSPISTLPSATSSPPPPPLPVLPTPDSTATVTTSTDDTYDLAPPLPHLTHAVIVGCHAIWTGGPTLGEAEDEWVLQSIQTGNHAQDTFVAHIRAGVEEAEKDPNALLIFSGGETRVGVGPRMEGTSYFELASSRSWLPPPLLNRTTTELGALDSYQNLLFSLARFHELTGAYPQHVTFISYAFKKSRFVDLHRVAIQFPADRFRFVGIDPVFVDAAAREQTETGERENAVVLWEKDPYACGETVLRGKRRERNLGRRVWGYSQSAGREVARLLKWCDEGGSRGLSFDGTLPWAAEN